MHLPVGVLLSGAAGRFGGDARVWMNAFQRQIFEDVIDLAGGDLAGHELGQGLLGILFAEGALVIGVLDNGHRRTRITQGGRVMVGGDGNRLRFDGRRLQRGLPRRRRLRRNWFSALDDGDRLIESLQRLRADERLIIEEEAWRTAHAARERQLDVGPNLLLVLEGALAGVELLDVQPQLRGESGEHGVVIAGIPLADVLVEEVVHLPIGAGALFAGAAGGVGGGKGLGMDAFQGEVIVNEAHFAGSYLSGCQFGQRLLRETAAERALEIRELFEQDGRVEITEIGASFGGEAGFDPFVAGLGRGRGARVGRGGRSFNGGGLLRLYGAVLFLLAGALGGCRPARFFVSHGLIGRRVE